MARGLVSYPLVGTVDGVEGDHVLYTPPLTITRGQVDELIAILDASLTDSRGRPPSWRPRDGPERPAAARLLRPVPDRRHRQPRRDLDPALLGRSPRRVTRSPTSSGAGTPCSTANSVRGAAWRSGR
jgi:hypothetical protein